MTFLYSKSLKISAIAIVPAMTVGPGSFTLLSGSAFFPAAFILKRPAKTARNNTAVKTLEIFIIRNFKANIKKGQDTQLMFSPYCR